MDSLEYDGLIQMIRISQGKVFLALRAKGKVSLIRQLYYHKKDIPRGDLLLGASHLFGWIKQTLGEDSVRVLFDNLILNKTRMLFGLPHVAIRYLLDFDWDKESMQYFIRLVGKGEEEGGSAFNFLLYGTLDGRQAKEFPLDEEKRKTILIDTLRELMREGKDYDAFGVRQIIEDRFRVATKVGVGQGASPLSGEGLLKLVASAKAIGHGSQFESVYACFDKEGRELPFVVKVPTKYWANNKTFKDDILKYAKEYMGQVFAPFNVVTGKDAVWQGEKYPFLVIQKQLSVLFRSYELPKEYTLSYGREINLWEKKREILLNFVKRGAYYNDISPDTEYGLDTDTGELYFVDFEAVHPRTEIDGLVNRMFLRVQEETSFFYSLKELNKLWGIDYGKRFSVPDVAYKNQAGASPLVSLRNSNGESLQEIIAKFIGIESISQMGIWDYKENKIIRVNFWEFLKSQMQKENWVYSSEEERLEAERISSLDNQAFEEEARKVWPLTDIPHNCSIRDLLDDMSRYDHEFDHHIKNAWSVEAMARSAYKSNKDKMYLKYINNGVRHKIIIREMLYRWGLPEFTQTTAASPMQKNQDDLGGIDMRHLAKNTVIEKDGSLKKISKGFNADGTYASKELQEIQRLIQAGIIPATERLQECRKTCQPDALLSCIADILRIEEVHNLPAEGQLKELLVKLEAG